MVPKLEINDARVSWDTATFRRKTYHYMKAKPANKSIATIFLLHGFPDLAFGWRYQVLSLQSAGYEVIAPDMLGFGLSSAPCHLSMYTLRNIAEDIKDLAHLTAENNKIILGGHGWGGAAVWRTALWFPDLVQGIFTIGTPFVPPFTFYQSLEDFARRDEMKSFRHQLQFQWTGIKKEINDEAKVRQFLNAMFGGKSPQGKGGFDTVKGVALRSLAGLNQSELLSAEELDHYVSRYFQDEKAKLEGPLSWYRTQSPNYLDELRLLLRPIRFSMPALFLSVGRDDMFPQALWENMDQHFVNLTHGEVDPSHWAHWESPLDVNQQLMAWLTTVVQ